MFVFFFPKIPLTKCVAWWWEHGADIVSSETPADLWSILLFWLCALFPSVLLQQVLWVEQDLKTVILADDKSPDVFPSNRDVDWEKCETPCCWYVKWRCSDPVLQKCLFLPKCTENNYRKIGDGHSSRMCRVCGSALRCTISEHFSISISLGTQDNLWSKCLLLLGHLWVWAVGEYSLLVFRCSEEHSSTLDVVSPLLSVSSWLNHDKSCPVGSELAVLPGTK